MTTDGTAPPRIAPSSPASPRAAPRSAREAAPRPWRPWRVREIADGPYAAAWREHRRRDRIALALFLGYLPGVALLAGVLLALFGEHAPVFVAAIAWMAATWVAGNRAVNLRCPRCGRSFFRRRLYHNGFARRCLHCGLPKWASQDPAPPRVAG